MHCFWNTCGKDAHLIDMFLPGGFEDYLYELCAVYKRTGTIQLEEVEKFIHKYDIEVHFELLEPIIKKYKLNSSYLTLRKIYSTQRPAGQYVEATNIYSTFCSLFGFSSG